MTREFLESGQSIPVTVIRVEKGRVLDVITKEKRGYSAVKVGFFKIKNSKLTKQMKGYFAKKNTEPKKILRASLLLEKTPKIRGKLFALNRLMRSPLIYRKRPCSDD